MSIKSTRIYAAKITHIEPFANRRHIRLSRTNKIANIIGKPTGSTNNVNNVKLTNRSYSSPTGRRLDTITMHDAPNEYKRALLIPRYVFISSTSIKGKQK